jgi:hypothetical protein
LWGLERAQRAVQEGEGKSMPSGAESFSAAHYLDIRPVQRRMFRKAHTSSYATQTPSCWEPGDPKLTDSLSCHTFELTPAKTTTHSCQIHDFLNWMICLRNSLLLAGVTFSKKLPVHPPFPYQCQTCSPPLPTPLFCSLLDH